MIRNSGTTQRETLAVYSLVANLQYGYLVTKNKIIISLVRARRTFLAKLKSALALEPRCHATVYTIKNSSVRDIMSGKMEKWKESVLQVNTLVHAVNSFPACTPKRWSLVSQLVTLISQSEGGGCPPFIEFDIPSRDKSKCTWYTINTGWIL